MQIPKHTTIFKNEKPAFLQNSLALQNQKQPATTNKLAALLEGKLDEASVSKESKELLQQLRDAKELESEQKLADGKQSVTAFLQLAQQSLSDLSNDIDTQLQNVDILESTTATAEEKAAALENISYIESTANLRGGIFTNDLLNKVVPNAASAVELATKQAGVEQSDSLLQTSAASLGLENIKDKSPAEMRELLIAAKEKIQQKSQAIGEVTKTFQAMDIKLSERKTEAQQSLPFKLDEQSFQQWMQTYLMK